VPPESPTLGFTHLQFEALLTTARTSSNPCDFALVAMLGLLGLRIFEATGADIADLGEEHGHQVLRVCGKGTQGRTAGELREGGFGSTFGKALLTTRVLCGIISARMDTSIRPAWTTTASDVRDSRNFWDWYGGKVSLPEPAGGLLAVSFDPLLWGQDDASSPIRLSFLVRGLPGETIGRLYPVYLQMLARANEQIQEKLGAGPAAASDKSEDWWIVPFPIRPERAIVKTCGSRSFRLLRAEPPFRVVRRVCR
jgi:hypothetical protein